MVDRVTAGGKADLEARGPPAPNSFYAPRSGVTDIEPIAEAELEGVAGGDTADMEAFAERDTAGLEVVAGGGTPDLEDIAEIGGVARGGPADVKGC